MMGTIIELFAWVDNFYLSLHELHIYGSELLFNLKCGDGDFLNCLHGSERSKFFTIISKKFLSCLLGSEPQFVEKAQAAHFLSCLLGSEHKIEKFVDPLGFLSCLFGSERPC